MKKLVLFTVLSGWAILSSAQISDPVKWTYTATKVADKTYDIQATAILEAKWHIYAQNAGEGPESTSMTLLKNPLVKPAGKVKEVGKLETAYDPNFNSTLRFYENKVSFVQRVKTKSNAATVVKGNMYYMVCNDKKCLPPKEIPFFVNLNGK